MPTATIGTGGDHASITAWESSTQGDLSGTGVTQGLVKKEELATETPVIDGSTNADASNYRELTTDAGAAFNENSDDVGWKYAYDSSYASMLATAIYDDAITPKENYCRITNMQFNATNVNNSEVVSHGGAIPTGAIIKNCIGDAARGGIRVNKITLVNCLVVIRGVGNGFNGLYAASAYNCAAINLNGASATGAGFISGNSNFIAVNCYAVDFADGSSADFVNTFGTSNNNASVDGTEPGTSGVDMVAFTTADVISVTADFTPVAGGDFDAAGAEDVTNAPLDVLGVERPTACEIGPMQIPVALVTVINLTMAPYIPA